MEGLFYSERECSVSEAAVREGIVVRKALRRAIWAWSDALAQGVVEREEAKRVISTRMYELAARRGRRCLLCDTVTDVEPITF